MTYAYGNTFNLFPIGARIVFHLDDAQKVSELTLIANGELKAKKVE